VKESLIQNVCDCDIVDRLQFGFLDAHDLTTVICYHVADNLLPCRIIETAHIPV
jgi:hypothetical protein